MTPSRPYLLRAFYEWILDNGMTPQVLVDATTEGTVLPQELAQDGRIVFNISPMATKNLRIGNDAVEFQGKFGNQARTIYLPLPAIIAIYARENPEESSIMFSKQDIQNYQAESQQPPESTIEKIASPLKLIKKSKK